jgi:hypothetical protein
MALPTLTPEQRESALQKARVARTARAAVKNDLKTGKVTFAELLSKVDDEVIGKMKVSSALEALPRIGKVRASSLMEVQGIAPTRRLRGLGARQSDALVAAVAEIK